MKTKIIIFIFALLSVFLWANNSKADSACSGEPDNMSCWLSSMGSQTGTCQSGTCIAATGSPSGQSTGTGSPSGQPAGTTGSPSGTTGTTTASCGAGYTPMNGVCFPSQTGLSSTDVKTIITNILYWLLGIFGVIAIIAFMISGTQYLMSAGNETMVETAKRNMVWSIVGVVVALSGLIIIYAIDAALRGSTMF